MSRLIDRLEKGAQSSPEPMGFGAASGRTDAVAAIILVGRVTPDDLTKDPALADAPVDAVLVSLDSAEDAPLDELPTLLKDRMWGVQAGGLDEAQASRLKEAGCDFIVFDAGDTAAAVLGDEDLGKILTVERELSEEAGRAIQDLPIDAVAFSPMVDIKPLTIKKLIDIQQVRGLVDGPFIVDTSSELGVPELEAFRNVGIGGLLVELKAADTIAGLKESISKMKRPKPKPVGRGMVVLRGHSGYEPASAPEDGDDEDDEDRQLEA